MIHAVSAASIFAGVCAYAVWTENVKSVRPAMAGAIRREGVVMVVSPSLCAIIGRAVVSCAVPLAPFIPAQARLQGS
jgi:hypothetical protein